MSTKTYRITNPTTGADLGTYEGADPADALSAMAIDAGCPGGYAALCEDVPAPDGGLRVVEVAPTLCDLVEVRKWIDIDPASVASHVRLMAHELEEWRSAWVELFNAGIASDRAAVRAAEDRLNALVPTGKP